MQTRRRPRPSRETVVDVGLPVALVLVAEVIVRSSSWPRFWVLVAALVVGYSAKALVQRWHGHRCTPSSDATGARGGTRSPR